MNKKEKEGAANILNKYWLEPDYKHWRDRFDYYVTYQLVSTVTVGVNAETAAHALAEYPFVQDEPNKPSTIHHTATIQKNTFVEDNAEYNARWERNNGRMDR